ncbi:MAG: hypothetical protein ACKV2U_01260 [Bryobacteraceae bacterium]
MRWDLRSAVQFLNGFRTDTVAMASFRRQAAATGSAAATANLSDEQVIQSLARMLESGEFLVAMPQRERRPGNLLGQTPVAPVAAERRSQTPAEVAEDEPTFEGGHDGVAQAAVLLAAARAAFPFCEECAQHAARQAALQ